MQKLSWNEIRLRARQFAHNFRVFLRSRRAMDCAYPKPSYMHGRDRLGDRFQQCGPVCTPLAATPVPTRTRKALS